MANRDQKSIMHWSDGPFKWKWIKMAQKLKKYTRTKWTTVVLYAVCFFSSSSRSLYIVWWLWRLCAENVKRKINELLDVPCAQSCSMCASTICAHACTLYTGRKLLYMDAVIRWKGTRTNTHIHTDVGADMNFITNSARTAHTHSTTQHINIELNNTKYLSGCFHHSFDGKKARRNMIICSHSEPRCFGSAKLCTFRGFKRKNCLCANRFISRIHGSTDCADSGTRHYFFSFVSKLNYLAVFHSNDLPFWNANKSHFSRSFLGQRWANVHIREIQWPEWISHLLIGAGSVHST